MKYYKIDVFNMETYDHLPEEERPESISGGLATHSFENVSTIKASNPEEILEKVKLFIGKENNPYIFDDRLEYQVNEYETLSFYITEVEEKQLDTCHLLAKRFPNLEDIT